MPRGLVDGEGDPGADGKPWGSHTPLSTSAQKTQRAENRVAPQGKPGEEVLGGQKGPTPGSAHPLAAPETESKIIFSSNLAKFGPPPVHPEGPGRPPRRGKPPGRLWTPLYLEMRGTLTPGALRGASDTSWQHSPGTAQEPEGRVPALEGGGCFVGGIWPLSPATPRGGDRPPRPSGSVELPLLLGVWKPWEMEAAPE